MKLNGVNGITVHVFSELSSTLEKLIDQAVIDNPDATLEQIVTRVYDGCSRFMEMTHRQHIEAYAKQIK